MSTWTLKAFSTSTQCVQGKHGLQLEAKKRGPPGAEISIASTSRVSQKASSSADHCH